MRILPTPVECLLILLIGISLGFLLSPHIERGNKFIVGYYLGITGFNILKELVVIYGPWTRTGEGYVGKGGKMLLEGIGLLVTRTRAGEGSGEERCVVPVEERMRGHEMAEILLDEQDRLHDTMYSSGFGIRGYVRRWREARAFYKSAERFNREIKDLVSVHTERVLRAQAKADMGDIAHWHCTDHTRFQNVQVADSEQFSHSRLHDPTSWSGDTHLENEGEGGGDVHLKTS